MRIHKIILLIAITINCYSQQHDSFNIKLVKKLHPQEAYLTDSILIPRLYSGSWRWYQEDKNREYAIVCGSRWNYFIDVTNPENAYICDSTKGVYYYGEVKTYKNYAYILAAQRGKNGIEIIDLKYLPDSVHVIKDSTFIFPPSGHTIWVDKEFLYIASHRVWPAPINSFGIYSLKNPEKPQLVCIGDDYFPFLGAHDIFVNNDTVYVSAAYQGLYVLKFNPVDSSLSYLGSFTEYSSTASYNHSSFITKNKKFLAFMDELPRGMPIRMVNVENPENIYEVSNFIPYEKTIPHNPFIIDNSLLLASCYEDGLYVYNIKDPEKVKVAGYFDTYPQGGANTGIYKQTDFAGAWGAYPTFSNNCVVVSDMVNGIFVLDINDIYKQLNEKPKNEKTVIYPIPTKDFVNIDFTSTLSCEILIISSLGEYLFKKSFTNTDSVKLDLRNLSDGVYTIIASNEDLYLSSKLIITK